MGADRSPGWALVGHRQQAVRAGELVEEKPRQPHRAQAGGGEAGTPQTPLRVLVDSPCWG